MDDITKRFLDVCKKIIADGIVKNNAQIAREIGTSNSTLSNLENGRSKIGLKIVQDFVSKYTVVNSFWLLTGKGQMLNTSTPSATAEAVDDKDRIKSFEINLRSINKVQLQTAKELKELRQTIAQMSDVINSIPALIVAGKKGSNRGATQG